jgi:hypothetical protein
MYVLVCVCVCVCLCVHTHTHKLTNLIESTLVQNNPNWSNVYMVDLRCEEDTV